LNGVPNVLAGRYASRQMVELWSPEHKVVLERRFWLAVLRAQRDLGVEVPEEVVEAYEAVVDRVDLASIDARERVTKHDVKARIEEFSALAGHEHVHKGMTSRDLTENVEQLQIRSALELVRERTVSALVQVASAPSSLATTIRLMAGQELATEGFKAGQVGSSAMPHKMNTRSCERINGLAVVLRGHLAMVSELAGDQWNEGDVSCSVVRRVALPDAFFALDGVFQTLYSVLDGFGAYPAMIERELRRTLPFLATTKVLVAAVRAGMGREQAHEVIGEHAVEAVRAMREKGLDTNDLFDRLAADPRLPVDRPALEALVAQPLSFVGAAPRQTERFVNAVGEVAARHPAATTYVPEEVI
jgi:adenylosuccinate lyase